MAEKDANGDYHDLFLTWPPGYDQTPYLCVIVPVE